MIQSATALVSCSGSRRNSLEEWKCVLQFEVFCELFFQDNHTTRAPLQTTKASNNFSLYFVKILSYQNSALD
jgi:hypothetical protein